MFGVNLHCQDLASNPIAQVSLSSGYHFVNLKHKTGVVTGHKEYSHRHDLIYSLANVEITIVGVNIRQVRQGRRM